MDRDFTDEDGRTWRAHAAEPAVEGAPYLLEFTSEGRRTLRAEHDGRGAPQDLSDGTLRDLLRTSTSAEE